MAQYPALRNIQSTLYPGRAVHLNTISTLELHKQPINRSVTNQPAIPANLHKSYTFVPQPAIPTNHQYPRSLTNLCHNQPIKTSFTNLCHNQPFQPTKTSVTNLWHSQPINTSITNLWHSQ